MGFEDQNRKSIEATPLVSVRSPFRSAPVCKHASKARDPRDAFRIDVQSENGGVRGWAWLVCVAVKNVDGPRCRVQEGDRSGFGNNPGGRMAVGGDGSRDGAVFVEEPDVLRQTRRR